MSDQTSILENIRKNTGQKYAMPDLDAFAGIQYADPLAQFLEISKAVGGNALVLQEGEDRGIQPCFYSLCHGQPR